MPCVFGPVPSRRLGLSLGVDLIPAKTCTYDCLYCEVGKTTRLTVNPLPFVPVREVAKEVKAKLLNVVPDAITLAGSGEPVLHSEIDRIIAAIKEITETRVAILTNGSLFFRDDIRRRVREADIIIPTLSTAFEQTFKRIHRPHPALNLDGIIKGLKDLRNQYNGLMFLEVILLAGINDTEKELVALKKVLRDISPDKIQLNTVVRPPADAQAESLDIWKLTEIMEFMGKNTEIVAGASIKGRSMEKSASAEGILETLKRRPLEERDIAQVLSLPVKEVQNLLLGLINEGKVRKQEHLGGIYYIGKENNSSG